MRKNIWQIIGFTFSLVIASCSMTPKLGASSGKYYQNDGPPKTTKNIDKIPNAVPKTEPIYQPTTKPYTVMGQRFVPRKDVAPYKSRGIASWYGTKYHNKKTANGEIYDMFSMSAAHPILPIPSYVKVTNLTNNKWVIVRINDRGPFLHGREIDLSYSAAYKLGIVDVGSSMVEVEQIIPNKKHSLNIGLDNRMSNQEKADKGLFLQFAAFSQKGYANNFLNEQKLNLNANGGMVKIIFYDGLYRVVAGPYHDQVTLQATKHSIIANSKLVPILLKIE